MRMAVSYCTRKTRQLGADAHFLLALAVAWHHNGSIRVAPAQASTGDFADGQSPQVVGVFSRHPHQPPLERGMMAAKWQQWIPFHIDRFMASLSVQAMHPAARWGYWCLITRQWQSEDCTISPDPLELSELSGLGDELWEAHGSRILRKFQTLEDGRLRNLVCYEEWLEAKRVYDKRRESADRTNTERSSSRSPQRSPLENGSVTDGAPSRRAYTRTGQDSTGEDKTIQNRDRTLPLVGSNRTSDFSSLGSIFKTLPMPSGPLPQNKSAAIAAGYEFINSRACGVCGLDTEWWRSPGGKQVPFLADGGELHLGGCAAVAKGAK